MKKNFLKKIFAALFALGIANVLQAQYSQSTGQTNNYIHTGIPILQISPDAVAGALGDAGAAYEP
ncbi:MAG: hypothetical protein IJK99_07220, partial [Bacteroidales bacterium]|nr:hypothetical protein [Bacteroidales bacterium]